jgi:hypothetical protein
MRIHRFAVISAIGWVIDSLVFLTLVWAGVMAMVANSISAGLGVSFVFLASQKTFFFNNHGFLIRRFAAYLTWNVVAIATASLLIGTLSKHILQLPIAWPDMIEADFHPIIAAAVAKVVVTPLTMYANFLVLTYIMEGRSSWI